ncbi:hypothetical protein GCM10022224_043910 [Nonomuraea antimicrobica]|uniref:Uncharacterized protein n=1 Tax=Nonomuraea antimicrobica TaxID=561173 RepID=A0ABP7C472_9ACTN
MSQGLHLSLRSGPSDAVTVPPGVARRPAALPSTPVCCCWTTFAGLDVRTRERLQETLARVPQHTGKTIVLVTRDLDEAIPQRRRRAVAMEVAEVPFERKVAASHG